MADRRLNWVLVIKCIWLAANVSIWLLGLGSCLTQPDGFLARETILPILYLLSFPACLLVLILNGFLQEIGFVLDASAGAYFMFMGMWAIGIGYLQWFHVLPRLFGERKVIVLSLNKPLRSSVKEHAPTTTLRPNERLMPKPFGTPAQIRPFDETGSTPLERVINQE